MGTPDSIRGSIRTQTADSQVPTINTSVKRRRIVFTPVSVFCSSRLGSYVQILLLLLVFFIALLFALLCCCVISDY